MCEGGQEGRRKVGALNKQLGYTNVVTYPKGCSLGRTPYSTPLPDIGGSKLHVDMSATTREALPTGGEPAA